MISWQISGHRAGSRCGFVFVSGEVVTNVPQAHIFKQHYVCVCACVSIVLFFYIVVFTVTILGHPGDTLFTIIVSSSYCCVLLILLCPFLDPNLCTGMMKLFLILI